MISSNYQLKINDFRLWLCLGVSAAEKKTPQAVSISIQIDFISPPVGTFSDEIADTLCYADMLDAIQQKLITHGPFNLLEHLTGCIYATIYHLLLTQAAPATCLTISVNKLTPGISNLLGGACCTYQSTLEQGKKNDLYCHWFESQ